MASIPYDRNRHRQALERYARQVKRRQAAEVQVLRAPMSLEESVDYFYRKQEQYFISFSKPLTQEPDLKPRRIRALIKIPGR